jgi:hypothetical protein
MTVIAFFDTKPYDREPMTAGQKRGISPWWASPGAKGMSVSDLKRRGATP